MDGAVLVINDERKTMSRLRRVPSASRSCASAFRDLAGLGDLTSRLRQRLGADDCLALPFEPSELVARVNACLRRPLATVKPDQLTAGPLVLDTGVHRLLVQGQDVSLSPAEFRLLAFLLENQGEQASLPIDRRNVHRPSDRGSRHRQSAPHHFADHELRRAGGVVLRERRQLHDLAQRATRLAIRTTAVTRSRSCTTRSASACSSRAVTASPTRTSNRSTPWTSSTRSTRPTI